MSVFTVRLRDVIISSGVQQKKLARDCGFSPSRLNNYITGRTEPSLDVLVSICKALEVSSDYLLGISDVKVIASAVSIKPTVIQRDSFDDLTEDQRIMIKSTLAGFRKANAAAAGATSREDA